MSIESLIIALSHGDCRLSDIIIGVQIIIFIIVIVDTLLKKYERIT
jgi:hypothetical protein